MTDLRNPIFHDDEAARLHLEAQRWPNGPYCPRCGEAEAVTRLSGKSTAPGLCMCNSCRTKFSVTMGTVFERSHIPLSKWMLGFRLMASSKKGISALQLQRSLDLKSYKSAWFMAHRIREAMAETSPTPMGGEGMIVEADETAVGGKERNKRLSKRNSKNIGKGSVSNYSEWRVYRERDFVAIEDRIGDLVKRQDALIDKCRAGLGILAERSPALRPLSAP